MTDAYVHVFMEAGEMTEAVRAIRAIDGVEAAHVVTGDWDIIAQVEVDEFDTIIRVVADEIHAVDGVVDTVTSVAFEG